MRGKRTLLVLDHDHPGRRPEADIGDLGLDGFDRRYLLSHLLPGETRCSPMHAS
ncbi:hypothetical protein [Streptomyces phaeochromogenes]|uniref:hypothetical protein n=1 Tax=Streptomyces phaeochromogenes TaxID=1923 RepID=UPI000A5636F6|nr:hypothetical protein [Streptomyces phaeochromogenes]WSS99561.1 hypothetical protein OG478_51960 [Streptomyces phaeochromogenes]WSW20955.1 hypothetical protein OG277_52795 [Streptomyces phaeochromogenes]WTA09891.1 hypothetical protein OHB08_50580 [Streptomyces phaeochromogenes]